MGDLTNLHSESVEIPLSQKEYLAAKSACGNWDLSLDAKFHIAMNFLENGPAAELGLAEPVREIMEFLERPDLKRTDPLSRIARPPRTDSATHAKLIGYKASRFDKIHSDPEQDYLGSLIKSLEEASYRFSTTDGPDFWQAKKDEDGTPILHSADGKIDRAQVRYEPEHQKKIDRQNERNAELDEHTDTVAKHLKHQVIEGLFTASRHWPSQLSYSSNWIDSNVEDTDNLSSKIGKAATDIARIGQMMAEHYEKIDDVVSTLLRVQEIERSKEVSPEAQK